LKCLKVDSNTKRYGTANGTEQGFTSFIGLMSILMTNSTAKRLVIADSRRTTNALTVVKSVN